MTSSPVAPTAPTVPSSSSPSHGVGNRVETKDDARSRGTVRWVGQVAGRSGTWIGVEWDDASRGKHDGTFEGQRYFTCEGGDGETPASMVRTHKLAEGRRFVEAFREKYARRRPRGPGGTDGNEEEEEEEEEDMYIRTSRGHKMRVELCETSEEMAMDAEEIRERLKSMTRAYADYSRIQTMGEPGEASGVAGPLRVLGLAGNLFSGWGDVLRIADEFPMLEALDLSASRLGRCEFDETSRVGALFDRLKILVMNNARLTWDDICRLSVIMPNVEELYVNGNAIGDFVSKSCKARFRNLRILCADDNSVTSWSEVESLGRQIPTLEKLHLGGNALAEIYPSDAFPGLKTLLVGDNRLADWASVDAMNALPRLEETRLTGNPIAQDPSARHEMIARVRRLTTLNASTVSVAERKDSEIRYLRRVLHALKDVSLDDARKASIDEANPRVQELVSKHGDLVTHAAQAPGNNTLGSNCVDVVLRLESTGDAVARKLPKSITIRRIRLLASKIFDIPVQSAHILIADGSSGAKIAPSGDDPLSSIDAFAGEIFIRLPKE